MPLKDPLLDCLNELANSLDAELQSRDYHVFHFDDVNDGKRFACSVCGVTFGSWGKEFIERHQSWCKVGNILRQIERAKLFLGEHS